MKWRGEFFKRSRYNPMLTFHDMPYECQSVFNPGATLVGNETLLLLRVEDTEGRSHLTVARSSDGLTEWRIEQEPLLDWEGGTEYEAYGCEDARLTFLEDLGKWVIAYTAYSPYGSGIALATTDDFRSVERFGLVLPPNNKDAAVFPRKINGKYWMLHRPAAGSIEHIWLTESSDLLHWGRPCCILQERGGPMWDGTRVGANTVPIETEEGWLILYHGVKQFPAGPTYRMGAALLDLDNPQCVLARLPHWILGPHEPYEISGAVPNIVFACGHTQIGNEIRLYYGAADSCVCMASGKIADLLAELRSHSAIDNQ